MKWNGLAQDSTQPIEAVMGQRFVLEAPPILYHGKTKNRFVRWEISSGGAISETITEPSFELLVTGEAKRYVAHYEFISASLVYYLPTMSHAPLD
jgi:hypothetical protein